MDQRLDIVADLKRIAGKRLTDAEIDGILETSQPSLEGRTPLEAWNGGDKEMVREMIRRRITFEDADAPVMRCTVCGSENAWPTGIHDPELGDVYLCSRHRDRSLDYT
jgi:hypothetical protein